MNTDVLLGAFSSVALFHTLFLLLILCTSHKGDKKANLILAFLLLSFTVRIFKSAYYAVTAEISDWMPIVGVIGMSFSGPTFYIYQLRLLGKWSKFTVKQLIHVLLPVILLFLLFDNEFLNHAYLLSILSGFIYLIIYFLRGKLMQTPTGKWLNTVAFFFFVFLLSYVLQYLGLSKTGYIISAMLAVLFLWILSYLAISKFQVLEKIHHYRLSVLEKISKEDQSKIALIKSIISDSENFRKTDFNLNYLAEKLDCSTSKISQLIQIAYQKKFPQILSELRIEYAEKLLSNPENEKEKIEALAYDAGFQSPSHFYAQFKKKHSKTPSEYRKTISS